jgi:hypothetical protein
MFDRPNGALSTKLIINDLKLRVPNVTTLRVCSPYLCIALLGCTDSPVWNHHRATKTWLHSHQQSKMNTSEKESNVVARRTVNSSSSAKQLDPPGAITYNYNQVGRTSIYQRKNVSSRAMKSSLNSPILTVNNKVEMYTDTLSGTEDMKHRTSKTLRRSSRPSLSLSSTVTSSLSKGVKSEKPSRRPDFTRRSSTGNLSALHPVNETTPEIVGNAGTEQRQRHGIAAESSKPSMTVARRATTGDIVVAGEDTKQNAFNFGDEIDLERSFRYMILPPIIPPTNEMIEQAAKYASNLRVNDFAFVKRSSGQWTLAKVISIGTTKENGDGEISMTCAMNEKGATKTFPKSSWGRYIRCVKGDQQYGEENKKEEGAREVKQKRKEESRSNVLSNGTPDELFKDYISSIHELNLADLFKKEEPKRELSSTDKSCNSSNVPFYC